MDNWYLSISTGAFCQSHYLECTPHRAHQCSRS